MGLYCSKHRQVLEYYVAYYEDTYNVHTTIDKDRYISSYFSSSTSIHIGFEPSYSGNTTVKNGQGYDAQNVPASPNILRLV